MYNKPKEERKGSSPPLPKLRRPLLILPQPVLTHTRSNRRQTRLEVLKPNRTDLVHWCVQQCFAQIAQWAHGGVFGEGCDVGAGEAYYDYD